MFKKNRHYKKKLTFYPQVNQIPTQHWYIVLVSWVFTSNIEEQINGYDLKVCFIFISSMPMSMHYVICSLSLQCLQPLISSFEYLQSIGFNLLYLMSLFLVFYVKSILCFQCLSTFIFIYPLPCLQFSILSVFFFVFCLPFFLSSIFSHFNLLCFPFYVYIVFCPKS